MTPNPRLVRLPPKVSNDGVCRVDEVIRGACDGRTRGKRSARGDATGRTLPTCGRLHRVAHQVMHDRTEEIDVNLGLEDLHTAMPDGVDPDPWAWLDGHAEAHL
jgi:hypothetical protein